ncbi:hypothetical protein ACWFR1_39030 [Streptomyces sp. NPDC055103]
MRVPAIWTLCSGLVDVFRQGADPLQVAVGERCVGEDLLVGIPADGAGGKTPAARRR